MRYAFMLMFALLTCSSLSAQTSFWTEAQLRTDGVTRTWTDGNGHIVRTQSERMESYPELHNSVAHSLNDKFGIFGWSVASGGPFNSWGEVLTGMSFKPNSFVELRAGAGFESNPDPWRTTATAFIGNDRAQFYTALEYGGSGYWYLTSGNVKVVDVGHGLMNIGVGAMSRTSVGWGPRVQFGVGKHIMFWEAALFRFTKVTQGPVPQGGPMVGLRYTP